MEIEKALQNKTVSINGIIYQNFNDILEFIAVFLKHLLYPDNDRIYLAIGLVEMFKDVI